MALSLVSRTVLSFAVAGLIWGSTWIVIKDQLAVVPPIWSVTYRFMIATVAMFALARLGRDSAPFGREGHLAAGLLSLLEFVLEYNFIYAAEQYITSGIVAAVFALLFVPNAIFTWLFFGHRVTARFLVGSVITAIGIGYLLVEEARSSPISTSGASIGIGLALLGMLSGSLANVLQIAERVKRTPLPRLLAWAMFYGVMLNGSLAAVVHGAPVVELRPGYWLGLLYLGIVASALAFWLYFGLLRRIGPAKASYVTVLIPIVAMGLSTAMEGYRWTILSAAGAALALVGMLIALRGSRTGRLPAGPSAFNG